MRWLLYYHDFLFRAQSHPEVIRAAQKALDDYGAGLSSVRFICGTQVRTVHIMWWSHVIPTTTSIWPIYRIRRNCVLSAESVKCSAQIVGISLCVVR